MPDEERKVMCRKLGEELPGLKRPPFKNELGKRLYEDISQKAWEEWLAYSVRIINTRGIDLGSAEGQRDWMDQVAIYFGYKEGDLAQTAWTPPKS